MGGTGWGLVVEGGTRVIMALCDFLAFVVFLWLALGFLGRLGLYHWLVNARGDGRDRSRAPRAIPGVVLVDGFNRLLGSTSDAS